MSWFLYPSSPGTGNGVLGLGEFFNLSLKGSRCFQGIERLLGG